MPRRMRLSDRKVARLRAEESEYTAWDTKVPCLGVRVRPSGHRTFIHLDSRDGSSRRRTLARTTAMTVDEARATCLGIQSGGPEVREPTATVPSFGDFVADVWKPECYARQKPTSRRHADYMLASQLVPTFGDRALDRIDRRTVNLWFDRYSVTAPGGANRTLDVLRQIMNHARVHGHIEVNPASGIRRNPGRKLDRFLSRVEIRCLHDELDRCVAEQPSRARQADIIRLLSCTGCRFSEIRTLKWREVGKGTLDLTDGKTGPRTVYLNIKAREIIDRQPRTDSPYVFPSPTTPSQPFSRNLPLWNVVRRRAGIEDVRLHDLRHTFASQAVLNGVALPTVAKLLGHRQVSMTLRYAHVADREVEAAAERIGDAISAICMGEKGHAEGM
ncbi:MAG: site-specific integrase [bacterium]|nr:site-specific integrase [bacterium]